MFAAWEQLEPSGKAASPADIADAIRAGQYPAIRLIAYADISEMIKATRGATWLVYAAGFTPNTDIRITVDNTEVPMTGYDATTGVLKGIPNAWGFGIAYPSQAPDGIHFDVGISSFLEHFYTQIPTITAHL
jgi:hypothetical protein